MYGGIGVTGTGHSMGQSRPPSALDMVEDQPRPIPPRSRTSSPLAMLSPAGSLSSPPTRSVSPDVRDGTKNRYLEDIRHEVMVNYLFQQQCAHLWLDHENPSDCEGVIVRKAKGTYLTCPPDLVHSKLASACFDLNLQVSITVPTILSLTFDRLQ